MKYFLILLTCLFAFALANVGRAFFPSEFPFFMFLAGMLYLRLAQEIHKLFEKNKPL